MLECHQGPDHRKKANEVTINHIRHLVNENITQPREIQRNVKMFVKSIFGSRRPSDINRRFYPSREEIRKIVYREKKRLMEGKLDQELLAEKNMARLLLNVHDNGQGMDSIGNI
ncbi:hypothetical protein DPMN_088905 [Dreissena polymorpha]|uniref:Uncharacterized protein n=1 Tax=Dreissena polymorpha TaxID=45954 RepID=A0A9D4QXQ1_DREPO|nr:hypothetical protein DPMN_088905 [Dreissena polymorpha]